MSEKETMKSGKEELLFSLDIGTRKVVGMVARKAGDKVQVIDMEMIEHKYRTMLDGQIHNIDEVAKVVVRIKETLEQRLNISLSQVGVAVAGRALKTAKAKVREEISVSEEITEEIVRNLELKAISSILADSDSEFAGGDYYCVGYSVVEYRLDGGAIGSLRGHFGREIEVEIIATFLPRVVLDSMFSVLNKCGLEITNLTLEPIAAIQVIIPEDVRRLNLALLDIGAGTSDIALTRDGAVFAYGMVPEAGDEITEMICEKFILDFNTAEELKRKLSAQPQVSFKDILGRTQTKDSRQVIEMIRPRIKGLAESLASRIKDLNQKVPHVAILVGGGSLTPLLEQELSEAFPLARENIGTRLPELIENIDDATKKMRGPEMITPLGICLMTARSSGLKFLELQVNERKIRLLDMHQKMDVLGALVACGIEKKKLYGKIGRALCVEINGRLEAIKGGVGTPARIKVNNKPAFFDTEVKNGDHIGFEEAIDGKDARAKMRAVTGELNLEFEVNGGKVLYAPVIKMNGFEVDLDTELKDRACIEYETTATVFDVLKAAQIDTTNLEEREIVVRVNKEPRILSQANFSLIVNGKRASLNQKIGDSSVIEFSADKPAFFRIKDVIEPPAPPKEITVMLNGAEHTMQYAKPRIFMNGNKVGLDEFIIDGAEILSLKGENVPPTVSEVLKFLSMNPEEQRGKMLKIVVNGEPGGFTTQLAEGADVSIAFIER